MKTGLISRRCLLAAPAMLAGAEEYFPPPDREGGWRRRPSAALDGVFEYIQGSTKNGGLAVVRDGWLIYERYFGLADGEAAPNLASCGKSVTSVATGILLGQRPEMFPEGLKTRVYSSRYLAEPMAEEARGRIQLGQLLSMTAGIRGNNPGYVRGREVRLDPEGPDGWEAMEDEMSLGRRDGARNARTLWCEPGEGYSYATSSIHLVSMILRRVSGRELEEFTRRYIAGPLGWGRWGWGYRNRPLKHTPGGGGIALRARDMLRFGYLLLKGGRWGQRPVVPESYVRACGRLSEFNPHYPYSYQFTVNGDGHLEGVPRDAFWKSGSGGHCLYVVPSLELVIWKMGGRDEQYDRANTGLPGPRGKPRGEWKARVTDQEAAGETVRMVIQASNRL